MSKITFEFWTTPSPAVVEHFANAFDIAFYRDEEELKKLFSTSVDSTTGSTPDLIEARVRRLNALYHTHLWEENIRDAVEFLSSGGSSFEARIKSGDLRVVKELADRKDRNCFVFATKYCSFVNAKDYPIFDSLVCEALVKYNETQYFADISEWKFEKIRQNREYVEFKDIVDAFIEQFELKDYPELRYKNLDKFLWIMGKNL